MTSTTLIRTICASPDIVYDALTTPEGIRSWWGPDDGPVLHAEIEPRHGGRFRVRFRMRNGDEFESAGTVVEAVRPERLTLTWRWLTGMEDLGQSRVDFALRAIPGGTELTLTHSELPNIDVAQSHSQGWSGSLDKLELHFLAKGAAHEAARRQQ